MNPEFLAGYQVVVFLDTRPEDPAQRAAFSDTWRAVARGWAFTSPASRWASRSIRRTGPGTTTSSSRQRSVREQHLAADLGDPPRRGSRGIPATKGLPATFKSNPSEWYRWEKDLRQNPDIDILLAVDSTSFPLGTGPKPHEIWHSGYYPVAWTNRNYKMLYFNFGHNDIDYDGGTNRQLSSTFSSPVQNELITRALLWLGDRGPAARGGGASAPRSDAR